MGRAGILVVINGGLIVVVVVLWLYKEDNKDKDSIRLLKEVVAE